MCNALVHVIHSGVSGQSVCNALVHVIYSGVSGQSACNALVHVIYSGISDQSVCNALVHVIYSGVSGQSVCNALVHVIYSGVSGQSVCNALFLCNLFGSIWSVSVRIQVWIQGLVLSICLARCSFRNACIRESVLFNNFVFVYSIHYQNCNITNYCHDHTDVYLRFSRAALLSQ